MSHEQWDRRQLLRAASSLGLAGTLPAIQAAEPPPETRRIRLGRVDVADVACLSPLWIAEELLRAEGFEDVQYVPYFTKDLADEFAGIETGAVDVTQTDVFAILLALDARRPLVGLGGIHAGCYELYGKPGLRTIRDLKDKTIAVANRGRRGFVSAMLAHVGLDPRRDVKFVESFEGVRLLAEGKVDATLGFPPDPQVMRARKIGVQLVNTAVDRPWSQYFCCMAIGNRSFVAKHPVATKRALRALVKAADLCATEPERVARTLVDRGFYKDYAASVEVLREVPYKRWREYDSADSLRFYALRLHEAGLVRSNPQKLLAENANWQFIEQLKREMRS
jgi:NitT/TauT family transport system substrate-binding protein